MHTMTSSRGSASPAFLRPRPQPQARMRLFCFPYAGGSASIYHAWPALLPADVELVAVQYPGRATRVHEPPCIRLGDLLDGLETAIPPLLDLPFAFFGHSMGATVAHELTRRLRAAGKPLPRHLFLSGRGAPQLPSTKRPIHALPEEEFLAAMREFNGTPSEILEHKELMELLLPVIRADFEALETWQYLEETLCNVPISAFGGIADNGVPLEHLDAWAACTSARFKRHVFPGDHFFLHQHFPAMLNIVSRALASA